MRVGLGFLGLGLLGRERERESERKLENERMSENERVRGPVWSSG